jgi:hypothetical protein
VPSGKRMKHDPAEGADPTPLVNTLIEDALAPYRNLLGSVLPPEVIAGFADTIDLFLTTHPDAVATLEQLQPRPEVAASVEIDRSGAAPEDDVQRPSGTEGGRR